MLDMPIKVCYSTLVWNESYEYIALQERRVSALTLARVSDLGRYIVMNKFTVAYIIAYVRIVCLSAFFLRIMHTEDFVEKVIKKMEVYNY